jgi:hypothetical protein
MLEVSETSHAAELIFLPVALTTTSMPSNRLRWWFVCPATRSDHADPCLRRVGRLYLPAGGRIFACRHCYDLTYESSRASRYGTVIWRMLAADTGIPPQAVKRLMSDDDRERNHLSRNPPQRAVFTDDRSETDVPSTSMGSVN